MLLDSEALEARAAALSDLLFTGALEEAARSEYRVSPMRTGQILREMPTEQALQFIRLVGWGRAGAYLAHFPPSLMAEFLERLEEAEAASLLGHLPAARIADVLPELADDRRDVLLAALPEELRQQVERLLSYASGTAGAEMSPLFLCVHAGVSVPLRRTRSRPCHPSITAAPTFTSWIGTIA